MITKGEWYWEEVPEDQCIQILSNKPCDISDDDCTYIFNIMCGSDYIPEWNVEAKAIAALVTAAGTSANKLNDMGYDGAKCVEMLPEIMPLFATFREHIHFAPDDGSGIVIDAIQALLGQLRKGPE